MAQLSDNLDTLLAVRTEPVLDSLEVLAASMTEASRAVELLVRDLDQSEGLIGALLADSTITEELQATLRNLERGTYKFDRNMEALQHSWPFKKFFKKQAREDRKKQP
jgi:phospholipid/cholesterol/gamma-HCH transport system substrate-binding protein